MLLYLLKKILKLFVKPLHNIKMLRAIIAFSVLFSVYSFTECQPHVQKRRKAFTVSFDWPLPSCCKPLF